MGSGVSRTDTVSGDTPEKHRQEEIRTVQDDDYKEDSAPPPSEQEPDYRENEDEIRTLPIISRRDLNFRLSESIHIRRPVIFTIPRFLRVRMGRERHQVLDTRSERRERTQRPQVPAGELWVDEEFTKEIAMRGKEDVDWKRPGVSLTVCSLT